ncbi:DALR anticodon-binding domain-containing protein [Chlorogloeopsis sp. ULAP02]|uniref:DALR anticodon-binding domain-containing protein n=1 Tax=Chlorogloeopsis sp. ULAP02 TaxID=3107926 RepID=UPI0031363D77
MLQVSKYTSIKQLVHYYLMTSLSIYTKAHRIECIVDKIIPLSKGRDSERVLYITGIALRLSKYENLPAMEIANAIASHLLIESSDVFRVRIIPPGWIHLELVHLALAAWLKKLVSLGVEKGGTNKEIVLAPEHPDVQLSSSVFPVQYAHARCCSLMRLARQEELFISTDVISWLNTEQKLRFNHPAEFRLMNELVQVMDELEYSSTEAWVRWEKAALSLSQAFENFWCNCRIWGEVKTTSPELALVRHGLIIATQWVLKFLLEEKLNAFAPFEL